MNEIEKRFDELEERFNNAVELAKVRVEAKAATKLWVVISISLVVGAVIGFVTGQVL